MNIYQSFIGAHLPFVSISHQIQIYLYLSEVIKDHKINNQNYFVMKDGSECNKMDMIDKVYQKRGSLHGILFQTIISSYALSIAFLKPTSPYATRVGILFGISSLATCLFHLIAKITLYRT
ncbi:MAG: hypothetical protein L0207_07060 [Chlamydiae bacterium]|nr:hypothetical protein [Chlamydiota bacterium]